MDKKYRAYLLHKKETVDLERITRSPGKVFLKNGLIKDGRSWMFFSEVQLIEIKTP